MKIDNGTGGSRETSTGGSGSRPGRSAVDERGRESINFFAELKRRNVYKVAVAYAVVAWLLIQAASIVLPTFEAPAWTMKAILVGVALGFAITVVLAWAFDITPEGIKRAEDVAPNESGTRRTGRKLVAITIALGVIAVGLFVFRALRSTTADKSIAVLPFENFSDDKANGYFADGIQDDILTSLAKIEDLRVISRTSVESYRGANASHNVRTIAQALDVTNVLEGSVRRVGDRMIMNVQLINAREDRHLWANKYELTLQDSLGIDGRVAREVARALGARVTSEEAARVTAKPTNNTQAFDLFLQAKQYEFKPDTFLQDYRTAEQLYVQAITLDSDFALAHARLAATRARIYHFFEPTDAWKKSARAEATLALQLQPNLGEAHHALGLCYYWFDRDYTNALREFEIARKLVPNDTSVSWDIAAIKRRQGQWAEAISSYRQILTLDPQNANVVRDLFYTYCAVRDWPKAKATAQQLVTLTPDSVNAKTQLGYVAFWSEGSTAQLKSELAKIPAREDPDGIVTACRLDVSLIDRDLTAAEEAIASSTLDTFSYFNAVDTPRSFFAGEIALLRGDNVTAHKELGYARDLFALGLKQAPNIPEAHAFLGLNCALLGEKDRAVAEGKRAVELRPESKDALDGTVMSAILALIYTRVGEHGRALDLLEHLISTPGPVDSASYSITVSDLRKRWEWDPIRNEPRFQKLCEEKEP